MVDAPSPFVHLDVRSFFSIKEGAFSPEALAQRAAALGMPAVALTDRDGLYGAARFVAACAQVGVRPLLGATLTTEARATPAHRASVVVIAQDARGYADLCRLITDAHMLGERSEPSLDTSQLLAHSGGLVCLMGPQSSIGRLAVDGWHDA